MSSLGDIIQAIPLANWFKENFLHSSIHWVVDKKWQTVLERVDSVDKVITIDKQKWRRTFQQMRKEKYDYVFDIQGNIKSGLITFLAKAPRKIGLHQSQVREWPSSLATTDRIKIDTTLPMPLQYLEIGRTFFDKKIPIYFKKQVFSITEVEVELLEELLQKGGNRPMIMVCPASTWENKRLSAKTWTLLIKRIGEKFNPYFFFIFGSEKEKEVAETLHKHFPEESAVVGALPIALWQNLMTKMSAVLSVDSSALHLAGLAGVPTFSIFGPTQATIFQPVGENHISFQGACPYGEKFPKQCKFLRDCKSGKCIKGITQDELFDRFSQWFSALHKGFDRIEV
jgi:heptosyltransferase-1